ncbi:DUF2934 domain-containing protein [Vulcaniibacterium thermophilum]|uniref:DUF2934 domain-containing protein n=1 Tax=Vulcaniibacterium thermophilum TaxID=1169913 RepID=A0A918ZAG5_9GAMM|nr:DUF2934 domain-containing protein [Vulcaniibacterium thermophilum]GHE42151.1 hypothetical protein GCM10007167_25010 [Vulcaniibacterium thermophilum]
MNPADREARIRALAQRIWEVEGRPEGQALRHWTMAERLVEAELQIEQARAAPTSPAAEPPARRRGTRRPSPDARR